MKKVFVSAIIAAIILTVASPALAAAPAAGISNIAPQTGDTVTVTVTPNNFAVQANVETQGLQYVSSDGATAGDSTAFITASNTNAPVIYTYRVTAGPGQPIYFKLNNIIVSDAQGNEQNIDAVVSATGAADATASSSQPAQPEQPVQTPMPAQSVKPAPPGQTNRPVPTIKPTRPNQSVQSSQPGQFLQPVQTAGLAQPVLSYSNSQAGQGVAQTVNGGLILADPTAQASENVKNAAKYTVLSQARDTGLDNVPDTGDTTGNTVILAAGVISAAFIAGIFGAKKAFQK